MYISTNIIVFRLLKHSDELNIISPILLGGAQLTVLCCQLITSMVVLLIIDSILTMNNII